MLLNEKLTGYQLILASHSPRRRQLLAGCDLKFELAESYEVEEIYPHDLPADEVPLYLAGLKSKGYPAQLGEQDILLTADTVVIVGGEILGKPSDADDAVRMLRKLSGRTHRVVTGVVLRSARRTESFSVASSVTFRPLDEEEIGYYVEHYRPMDKAGSYGIQEWIGYVGIESIEGSFYNVMGLPVQRLYTALSDFVK